MGRPQQYDRQRIGELITQAIQTENQYAPYPDPALLRLLRDQGEECSRYIVPLTRNLLGIPDVRERKVKYREEREATNGR